MMIVGIGATRAVNRLRALAASAMRNYYLDPEIVLLDGGPRVPERARPGWLLRRTTVRSGSLPGLLVGCQDLIVGYFQRENDDYQLRAEISGGMVPAAVIPRSRRQES